MKVNIATIEGLLSKIPEDDRPKGEEEAKFWWMVARELALMLDYSTRAADPQIVFKECRKAGEQYIFEFYVNDLKLPVNRDQVNWHLQNTSQWLYAEAIVIQGGKASSHH